MEIFLNSCIFAQLLIYTNFSGRHREHLFKTAQNLAITWTNLTTFSQSKKVYNYPEQNSYYSISE